MHWNALIGHRSCWLVQKPETMRTNALPRFWGHKQIRFCEIKMDGHRYIWSVVLATKMHLIYWWVSSLDASTIEAIMAEALYTLLVIIFMLCILICINCRIILIIYLFNYTIYSLINFLAFHGHERLVDQLLALNSNFLNARDSTGSTPLHESVKGGHLIVTKRLIDLGADVNATDNVGQTILRIAAIIGNEEAVKDILEN